MRMSRCRCVLAIIACSLFVLSVPAQILVVTEVDGQTVIWEMSCDTLDAWWDSADDPSMGAKVDQPEPSVVRVTQTGDKTWGKASCLVKNVDIRKFSRLDVRVNEVGLDSAFIVGVAPKDWSEFITVIERSSAHGLHTGNIWRAIKQHARNLEVWEGEKDFHLVVVIEGADKSSIFDNFAIRK